MPYRFSIIALLAYAAACGPSSRTAAAPADSALAVATPPPAKAVNYGLAGWAPPSLDSIPDDSLGNSIRRGLHLLRHTRDSLPRFATSSLNCTSCHLEDGLAHRGGTADGLRSRGIPST